MAKKEPLYPHIPEGKQEARIHGIPTLPASVTGPASLKRWAKERQKETRQVSKITYRPGGGIMSQYVFTTDEIDDTLRAYFNIGATMITIKYDTGQKVEWALVPE